MSPHRLVGRALVALTTLCGLTALTGAPAQATEVVDCSTGPIALSETNGVYQLVGACSQVSIEAPGISVTLAAATRLDVNGTDAQVGSTGPIGALSIVSSGAVVSAPSIHVAHLAGTGTKLTVGRVDRLSIDGTDVTAHVKKGIKATITGTSSRVVFSRLQTLRVTGTRDHVVVRKGITRVSNTGSGNHIRVHARPRTQPHR